MKKQIIIFLIPLLTFLSCYAASSLSGSLTSSFFYPVNMRPSQVKSNGSVFYTQKMNDSEYIEVYYDSDLSTDATYYYNQLMASYGWTRNGNSFSAPVGNERPSYGTLHISVKRGVAVYMYPEGEFRVFKVKRLFN